MPVFPVNVDHALLYLVAGVIKAPISTIIKVFDVQEWLAAMCSHVPNRGEQMVRYYGWYSNVLRGKRRKKNTADVIPCIIESDRAAKACRKSWARLIQKIYEVDPLTCPNSKNQRS